MKAGEYVGKDGQTRRWERFDCVGGTAYQHGEIHCGVWIGSPHMWGADIDAAKAALDALIAEQDAEWVEWKVDKFDYRAKPDGSVVQWRTGTSWTDVNEFEQADYRKGREVAQAEHEALRVQMRALVVAIGKPYSVRFTADVREKPGSAECMYYQIEPTGMVRVDGVWELVEWAESVQEAAKAVQL